MPGVVAVIQSFGENITFHPHAHLLVKGEGEDSEGIFHYLSEFRDILLAEFFKHGVFVFLLRQELISDALVEKILALRHSGFSIHSKVKAKTRREAERVGNT